MLNPESSTGSAQTRPSSPEERLALVRSLISERGTVRIDELASDLGVSEMTIRRDLDELETLGVARRVRGGAIAVGPEPFDERHRNNARAKAQIGEKLAPLIPAVGTVAFDASSTVYRAVAAFEHARDLTIMTNGFDTFQMLLERPGVEANLTGGFRDARTGSFVGPIAVRAAESLLYDVFITSSAALDPEMGSSETTIEESQMKRAFSRGSDRIILAVDHTKLGTRSQARMFDLGDIDLLVTDLDPGDARMDPYRDLVELL